MTKLSSGQWSNILQKHTTNSQMKNITNNKTQITQLNTAYEIYTFLTYLNTNYYINDDLFNFLEPNNPPRTPIFYMLPKIHKPNNPGQPIISGCDSPTANLSVYLDYYLKPIVQTLPPYPKFWILNFTISFYVVIIKVILCKFGVSKVKVRKILGGGWLPFGKGRVKVNGFRIFIRFPDCAIELPGEPIQ